MDLVDKMFKEIGCEAAIENREIRLLTPLSAEQLQNIMIYPARNHEVTHYLRLGSWKYFVKRKHGAKVNTFVLEPGVARLVKSLSAAGISTYNSCDGHGEKSPSVTFSGYAQGAWFDFILSEIKKKIELNYAWRVNRDCPMGPTLMAKKTKNQVWTLAVILEDTTKIAEIFLGNAEEISKTKREIFGAGFKAKRRLVKTMDKQELYEWMSLKYKEHYTISNCSNDKEK